MSSFPSVRLSFVALLAATTALAQQSVPPSSVAPSPSSGTRYNRLLIRNAMVIDGAGNPARGPMDIVVTGSTIASITPARPINEFGTATPPGAGSSGQGAASFARGIDATGMYLTPGLVDVHAT